MNVITPIATFFVLSRINVLEGNHNICCTVIMSNGGESNADEFQKHE